MHTAVNHFNGNDAAPRDLRSDGPAEAGGGNVYPVDPAAAARLHAFWQQQTAPEPVQKGATMSSKPTKELLRELQTRSQQNGQTAVPSTSRVKPELTIDPAETYPASVIRAAQVEAAKDGRRNLRNILTDDVLAIWDQWNTGGGKSLDWIAANNGLLELNGSQVSKYLQAYRKRQKGRAQTKPAPPVKTGTAVSQPVRLARESVEPPAETETAVYQPASTVADAEAGTAAIDAELKSAGPEGEEETAVTQQAAEPFAVQKPENLPAWLDRDYAPPRPGPGDALAALAALVNNERLRVRGSVKLNLEIEFGD